MDPINLGPAFEQLARRNIDIGSPWKAFIIHPRPVDHRTVPPPFQAEQREDRTRARQNRDGRRHEESHRPSVPSTSGARPWRSGRDTRSS